jgi:hypothetical protein
MFCEQPARIFGSTEDLGAITLDDERDLQMGSDPIFAKTINICGGAYCLKNSIGHLS